MLPWRAIQKIIINQPHPVNHNYLHLYYYSSSTSSYMVKDYAHVSCLISLSISFTPPTRPSNNTTIKLSNLSNIYRLVLWIQYSDSIFEQKSIPFYSSFFTFPGTYDHDNAFNGRAFFIWHPYPFLNDEEHHQIDKKRSQGNIIVLLLATHPWQVVLPFTLDIWVGSWYEKSLQSPMPPHITINSSIRSS